MRCGSRPAKTSRGRSSKPWARNALPSAMALMLSPPRAKKSASALTAASFSTVAMARQSSASAGVAGASPPVSAVGAGRRARSTLPLTVSGKASSTTSAEGTM